MIPYATTTVTVVRETEAEPGEGVTDVAVASGVRAVIGSPSGREVPAPGGGSERVDAILDADPIPGLDHLCRVTDANGIAYKAAWVEQRTGLGLDHTVAGLVRVKGRVPA